MARSIHVAVVDDDPSVRQSLCRMLRLRHIQASAYASAEAFLADSAHPPFDCLVLDVRLGGMSGLDLFARLAAAAHPPVIFIAAVDEPKVRARAEALGCAGFYSKSTPGAGIVEAIRRVTCA